MKKTFVVNIITPTEELTKHNVEYATIETDDGIEGFLADHQSDSYHVKSGVCFLTIDNVQKSYEISAGNAKFENNVLVLSVMSIKKLL